VAELYPDAPYTDSFQHLRDEFSRIDRLISDYLETVLDGNSEPNEFMGLYISETEIKDLQRSPGFLSTFKALPAAKRRDLDAMRNDLNSNIAQSLKKGTRLRLNELAELFGLDTFEIDVLLIGLAPELDLKYEKIYAYLQNDVTLKRPRIDLAMNLLCPTVESKLRSRKYFSPFSHLIANDLIHLTGDGQNSQLSLISSFIRVDERIVGFLLGSDEADRKIRDFTHSVKPESTFDDLILPRKLKNRLKETTDWHIQNRSPLKALFSGASGSGKMSAAKSACMKAGKDMLVADAEAMFKDDPFKTAQLLLREALLQNAALYLDNFGTLFEDQESSAFKGSGTKTGTFVQALKDFPEWIFLAATEPLQLNQMFKNDLMNNEFTHFSFPLPSYMHRRQLWGSCLQDYDMGGNVDLTALAGKFQLTGGQIKNAMCTAYALSKLKSPSNPVLSVKDIYEGCRMQSNQRISSLAIKLDAHYTWEDIILPKDTKEQLKEVCGFITYRGKVYYDWGFEKKLSLGKGLNVLFYGPSGTGKTMAAEIVANMLDMDIYKIDLSNVVSKYIGETEKNLEKIFDEAKTSNSILFFDEADAIFGKRSEVKDAHDRYANIEISYLLQKMEEHVGTVILASNFRKNIDDAFLRRLHFAIEFPLPDERSRELIWLAAFPAETPLGDDVDFAFLSKFKFTGGNIKNIALAASFLAAEECCTVKMEHLIKAAKRELQKIGKLFTEADFGEYSRWVKKSGEKEHV
jgi:AAA+ superfamily predicted ATPase